MTAIHILIHFLVWIVWFPSGALAYLILVGTFFADDHDYWKNFDEHDKFGLALMIIFGIISWYVTIGVMVERHRKGNLRWAIPIPRKKSKSHLFLDKLES